MKPARFKLDTLECSDCSVNYIYDSKEDICYYSNEEYDLNKLCDLLNWLNNEVHYYKVSLISNLLFEGKVLVESDEERFEVNKNFPSQVMDKYNKYGQYYKLMGIKECAVMLNKLYNENKNLYKILEENNIDVGVEK